MLPFASDSCRGFLNHYEVEVLELSAEIGYRADTLMEDFHLEGGAGIADCLIAASASVLGVSLLTANARHFRCFPMLDVHKFVP